MNVVARMTLRALEAHGVTSLLTYRRALISACNASPPPFGRKAYGDLYRESASGLRRGPSRGSSQDLPLLTAREMLTA